MSGKPSNEHRDLLFARTIVPATRPDDFIALTYSARLLRRRRLESAAGCNFVADLAETVGLKEGDAFLLDGGRQIAVKAADEDLLEIRGDLVRLAWHIGNRHTPCEISPDYLRVSLDHVLEDLMRRLGANVTHISAPFHPEGGAYGHGRTFAHAHGHKHDP